jgi:hypothetical protein
MEEQTAEIGGYSCKIMMVRQDQTQQVMRNYKYVGTEEITYLDFMSYEPSDEIIAFFDRNRFSLIRGYNITRTD